MARLIDADAFDRRLAAAEFDAALNNADDENRPVREQALYYSTQSFRDVMRYQPTIDAIPVEATAKRLQRAFFSDSWEAWAEWLRGNYSDEDFAAHVDRKKDAIPVEWLREKIKEHTDEEGWQDYLANSFGLCIEEWQKEQEAQDGTD